MMECYRPWKPKHENYVNMWLCEHGRTSNGKEVAPWGQVRTDYTGEKVTVLIVCSLTNIRSKFKLYSFISRGSINECLLFFNSGCFCHLSHCFGQNVTKSTESFFKQWASLHAHVSASHPKGMHRPFSRTHIPTKKANLLAWLGGGAARGWREGGRGRWDLQAEPPKAWGWYRS